MCELYKEIAKKISDFEGTTTQTGRTSGEAQEGREFERIVKRQFSKFFTKLTDGKSIANFKVEHNGKTFLCLVNFSTNRGILFGPAILDDDSSLEKIQVEQNIKKTMNFIYKDSEIFDPYLPEIRGSLGDSKTKFDGVMLLVENVNIKCQMHSASKWLKGNFVKKMLLECKYAKSSDGVRIDGNAHERFSFQMLQYLLISETEPNSHLLCLTNSSYLKYKNKYHVGFSTHAVVLSKKFNNFRLSMISSINDYTIFLNKLHDWLLKKTNTIDI